MNESPLRWQTAALFVSLALHGLILWMLHGLSLPRLALPAVEAQSPHPFTVKRVEASPTHTEPALGPIGQSSIPGPNLSLAPDPSRQATLVAEAVQQATQANPPAPVNFPAPILPPAPDNVQMPVRISNQTERAVVEASVAQFQAATSTNLVSLAPPLPASLPGDGQGGSPGQPMTGSGGKGTNSNASGVPSFAELAPGFRPPTPGSLNGKLPEPVLLQLPSDILFDFDSSRLKPEADPLLQQALTMIQKYPRATIDVIGHTDTIGDDTYNQQLSEARALSVVTQLKQKLTASAYTLRSRGFGKTRPLVNPNGSAVEQSRNRRVEVIIQALAE